MTYLVGRKLHKVVQGLKEGVKGRSGDLLGSLLRNSTKASKEDVADVERKAQRHLYGGEENEGRGVIKRRGGGTGMTGLLALACCCATKEYSKKKRGPEMGGPLWFARTLQKK